MNRFRSLHPRTWALAALTAAAAISGSTIVALAKDAGTKPAKKKLTGEQLYAINCSRCHSERYPTERTAAQWKTLLTHMRVRANLPAAQAKELLKYMQEESGK
jgi:mono/diheme cytochrome c family protein